jgi:hypothetical protein
LNRATESGLLSGEAVAGEPGFRGFSRTADLHDAIPPPAPGWAVVRLARLRAALIRPPLWVTLVLCALILAARRPAQIRSPQFWAEEGAVFYADAYTLGASALVKSFGGYLNSMQRIVAAASQWADPAWAPAIFVAAAFVLTLYVAARTQSARFPLPPHVGYALAVVLVPDMFEVLLFLNNIDRITAAGFLLVLVSRDPRRWWQKAHDAAAVSMFGLTGPYSIVFAPLFLWRATKRRTRASFVLAVLVIGCALTQGTLIGLHEKGKLADEGPVAMGYGDFVPEKLLAVPGMRIAGSLLAGYRVPLDYSLPVETALGLGVLVAVALLALRKGPARTERVWMGIAFLLVLASALYRCRLVLPDLCHAVFGARYFYFPQLIVLWLLLALAVERKRWLSGFAWLLLFWIVAINIPRLREPGLQDFGWADYAPQIRRGEAVAIPTNPGGIEPWIVRLPARKP